MNRLPALLLSLYCLFLQPVYGQFTDHNGNLCSYPPGNPYLPQNPMAVQLPLSPEDPGQQLIQQQYDNAMKTMGYNPPPTQEQILRDLENARKGIHDQQQREKELEDIYKIISEEGSKSGDERATYATQQRYQEGKNRFLAAAAKLTAMIEGHDPLNLKRAVFLSESPACDNTIDYTAYCRQIEKYAGICKRILEVHKLNLDDRQAVQWAIQRLYTDTIHMTYGGKSRIIYPFAYDFEDYEGRKDIQKLFVSKLLKTHSGQCHSMPLLYAILAKELQAEAYIAYSPNHSYVTYTDKDGNWHNFETTSGVQTSDAEIAASGYIRVQAIKSGLYLRPNSLRETVVSCLADLVITYQARFGDDAFVAEMINKIVAWYPAHPTGLMLRANLITADMKKLRCQYKYPKYSELDNYPALKVKVIAMKNTYDTMDILGFADMPEEAYQAWLMSVSEKKRKLQTLKK